MLKFARETVVFIILLCMDAYGMQPAANSDVLCYVDPFIGTTGTGHTYPGAAMPFGLVQASPETGKNTWQYCSGYDYKDKKILSFGLLACTAWSSGSSPASS